MFDSVLAGWRRGVKGAADKDSLHGQSRGAHHPAPDFRQQGRTLSLWGEAPTAIFCLINQTVSELSTLMFFPTVIIELKEQNMVDKPGTSIHFFFNSVFFCFFPLSSVEL